MDQRTTKSYVLFRRSVGESNPRHWRYLVSRKSGGGGGGRVLPKHELPFGVTQLLPFDQFVSGSENSAPGRRGGIKDDYVRVWLHELCCVSLLNDCYGRPDSALVGWCSKSNRYAKKKQDTPHDVRCTSALLLPLTASQSILPTDEFVRQNVLGVFSVQVESVVFGA